MRAFTINAFAQPENSVLKGNQETLTREDGDSGQSQKT